MYGPYLLSLKKINDQVTRTSPGVYILLNIFKLDRRVGRSDKDLKRRLKNWVGKYWWFKFDYCTSPKNAFERECNLYHYYGSKNGALDNENHPQRPTGTNWKCPKCSIFD